MRAFKHELEKNKERGKIKLTMRNKFYEKVSVKKPLKVFIIVVEWNIGLR